MPKPIININQQQRESIAGVFNQNTNKSFESPELVFRRKRSQEYINKLKKLDILGHNISQSEINEIINAIKNELPEISMDKLPIGIIAKCYLGKPYEVHTLSMLGKFIVKHYKLQEPLPDGMEKARNLANNENYEFVEVYRDKIIAVKSDGSVSIIKD